MMKYVEACTRYEKQRKEHAGRFVWAICQSADDGYYAGRPRVGESVVRGEPGNCWTRERGFVERVPEQVAGIRRRRTRPMVCAYQGAWY
jgi:hypothetical protein